MLIMKKIDFNVHTSFVSPWTWKRLVSEGNNLPIIIVRNIRNSSVIGNLNDTAVHFRELSPSNELYRLKRDGVIDLVEFQKRYIIELSELNLDSVVDRFIQLFNVSGASGMVIFGYGSDNEACHRSTLASLLNSTGRFNKNITELIL